MVCVYIPELYLWETISESYSQTPTLMQIKMPDLTQQGSAWGGDGWRRGAEEELIATGLLTGGEINEL